jgi:probable rRNA maturation factor
VQREAQEQEIPFPHHLQHLVVHGLLHLLGFDHETEADANTMEGLEIEILARLSIANPYVEPVIATNP